MKVAVSVNNNQVSDHFGRCAAFMIYDIAQGDILSKEEIPNPGHEPGYLPRFLSEIGTQCIITGGMGRKAQSLFAQMNIERIVGIQGSVDEVIRKYLNHELEQGDDKCDHGGEC